MDEFMKKVATMRALQRVYFRERSQEVLRRCKALEAEVDKEIEAAKKAQEELKQTQEPTLF